jgi:hypothetical protein
MLTDPNLRFSTPSRSPQARKAPADSTLNDLPPLGDDTRSWLTEVARALGLSPQAAASFARYGMLTLSPLNVIMIRQQEEPPRWSLLGFIQPPTGISPLLWSEALLRANCVSMALDTCAWAQDASGATLLVKQLPFYHHNDSQALIKAIEQMQALGDSLLVTLTAAAQAGENPPEQPSPDMAPANSQLAKLGEKVDAIAEQQIHNQWHRRLLEQAFTALQIPLPGRAFGSVGSLKVNDRYIDIIADPDQRHLLLSTPVAVALNRTEQRGAALQSNLYLMTGAQCGVALAPAGASLQARWDSTGLDGNDLASWLVGFVMLAVGIDSNQRPGATSGRRLNGSNT